MRRSTSAPAQSVRTQRECNSLQQQGWRVLWHWIGKYIKYKRHEAARITCLLLRMIVFIFSSIFAFFSNLCVFSPNPPPPHFLYSCVRVTLQRRCCSVVAVYRRCGRSVAAPLRRRGGGVGAAWRWHGGGVVAAWRWHGGCVVEEWRRR